MKIETKHLPSRLAFEATVEEFPVLQKMVEQGECRFVDPIAVQIHVTREDDVIKVKGTLTTAVLLPCSRCLEEFEEKLQRRFTLRYSHEIPLELAPVGDTDVELSAAQMDLILYDGETIDFRDAVQEQVVLAFPFKPLCRDNCKGLCPNCGADLNLGACECKAAVANTPFAVLKQRKWPD